MFERRVIGREGKVLVAGLALALGVSACSGNIKISSKPTQHAEKSVIAPKRYEVAGSSGISEHIIYFADGTVEIQMNGGTSDSNNNNNGNGSTPANILEFCQGPNLIIETLNDGNNLGDFPGNQSSSANMVPNFSGCADGKLTPADFQLQKTN